ncbi:MAG TPA: excinuclease ABC subunit UvrA, partial [Ramlibacter sp.]
PSAAVAFVEVEESVTFRVEIVGVGVPPVFPPPPPPPPHAASSTHGASINLFNPVICDRPRFLGAIFNVRRDGVKSRARLANCGSPPYLLIWIPLQNRSRTAPMLTHIQVRGAREHNLKGVDVDLPRDKLIVITGLSGSGKSSLAFDTIYAEGQRRYVESLSAYARQFLELMQKPDVDHIEGLSPAISIEQKTTSRNPRSTVATVTEIYDYMRLLWARVGIPYSPVTGEPIAAQQVSQMVDRVMSLPEGTRAYLLAPDVRGRKGEYRKELAEWQKAGFTRVRIDGQFYDIEDAPALDKKYKHDIEVVVDRIVVREGIETRLADSFEQALKLADGLAYVDPADPAPEAESDKKLVAGEYAPPGRIVFSERFACPVSGFTIPEIEPRLFSFNAPQGACPACDGLGEKLIFDEMLVVPNETLSLKKGAVVPWAKSNPPSPYYMQVLSSLARAYGFDLDTAWERLPEEAQRVILHGTGGKPVALRFIDGKRSYEVKKPFEGVIGNLNRRMLQTESAWMREELSRYQASRPCEVCHGARLKPEALSVKIAGEDISMSTRRSVADAYEWFAALHEKLTSTQNAIAHAILKEINERLGFLHNVGLDYLHLDRTSGTLSGGESQRIRLASQIGSGLSGGLYVLDEPAIGLHQKDNDRLLETLKRLKSLGNTVLVVEHDEDAIRHADHVIDMGPGAGVHGGEVVCAGTLDELLACERSITADYLSGRREIPLLATRRKGTGKFITVQGATANNLADVTVKFPLGTFTCVTGVSGSGKSSLTIDTLYAGAARALNGARIVCGPCQKISGLEQLDKVIDID